MPVVLYNGRRPWRAADQVSDLIAASPSAIAEYGPRQRYVLLDVERLPEPAAGAGTNLVALLFRIERSRTAAEAKAGLEALRRVLGREADPGLHRAFGTWLLRASRVRGAIDRLADEEETMFAQAMAEWRKELRAEAQASLLLGQLTFKFGPLDEAVRERVASATPKQIRLWAERLLVAPSLAEVFVTPS